MCLSIEFIWESLYNALCYVAIVSLHRVILLDVSAGHLNWGKNKTRYIT